MKGKERKGKEKEKIAGRAGDRRGSIRYRSHDNIEYRVQRPSVQHGSLKQNKMMRIMRDATYKLGGFLFAALLQTNCRVLLYSHMHALALVHTNNTQS